MITLGGKIQQNRATPHKESAKDGKHQRFVVDSIPAVIRSISRSIGTNYSGMVANHVWGIFSR